MNEKSKDIEIGRNPAAWLAKMCNVLASSTRNESNETYFELARKLMDSDTITKEDSWEFAFAFASQIHYAIEDIERTLNNLYPDSFELFEGAWTHAKSTFLSVGYSSSWKNSRELFRDGRVAQTCEMIAAVITKGTNPKTISASDLLLNAEALFEAIKASDVSDDIKQWLLGLVSSLIKSIHDYQAYGYSNFEERIKVILGELSFHHDIVAEFKEKNPQTWAKFWNIISLGGAVVRTSNAVLTLTQNAPRLLTLFGNGGDNVPQIPE
ncbi:hypothetical protein [Bremerella alba]|uniref:Uncharacterized protein n=1 Tax=Bremerella alba TaxID=980252 RepID=A0A7V8V2F3_9BACT|nr:hypothetical protein [Bremerella alba]MBA2113670.1 hypothetical protein [Bremerella alba]